MPDRFFSLVIAMSISASAATAMVMLFRWLFSKKMPRIYIYALWAIVLIKLLVPLSFSSVFSVFNLIPASEAVTAQARHQSLVYSTPTDSDLVSTPQDKNISSIPYNNLESHYPEENSYKPSTPEKLLNISIPWLWLAGAVGLMWFSSYAYFHTQHRLKTAVLYNDGGLSAECGRSLKLKRKIRIYTSDIVYTPVVCGLIQPRIILPTALEKDCSTEELVHIITHELVHIKRFDYVIKPLSVLALCIHWFNPIIWLCYVLSQKDMEISCDERVMLVSNSDTRKEYAASLIKLAVKQNTLLNGGLPAFGESNIKSRIKGIMMFKKQRFWFGAAAATILIAALVLILTSSKYKDAAVSKADEDSQYESHIQVPVISPTEEGLHSIDMSNVERVTVEDNGVLIQTIDGTAELQSFSLFLTNMTPLLDDSKIRGNRSSLTRFTLWKKDGTKVTYDAMYDNLYSIGYIKVNDLRVSPSVDFFRLLESYSLYPGLSYDVPDDARDLFKSYGWTISYKVNKLSETLPKDLKYQTGELPIKLYWAYNLALSDAIGLSTAREYLGRKVEIEIYRMNECLPEEYKPNIEARGVIVRHNGKIIGAYMDRGRHSSLACSLNMKTLEQATGKVWSEWVVDYVDTDNRLFKELKGMTPEELIKTSFEALDKGDYKRYYATFSLKSLMYGLSVNMDFSDLYNKSFPDTNIKGAKLLELGAVRDDLGYIMYPVQVDFDFVIPMTGEDGIEPRFIGVEKESEATGWRISSVGTGP